MRAIGTNTVISEVSDYTARDTAIHRAERGDYSRWLSHVGSAKGCVRPVRLHGRVHTLDQVSGEVVATRNTASMPDGVVYIPCGDRRAEVCPACAELYRADTYHLIKSGLVGGKGTPESVAQHPAVFATFTAPSFGAVHTRVTDPKTGRVKPCHMRRAAILCEHGQPTWCTARHGEHSRLLGTPLCAECYDYPGHVVWNAFASELWRRTTQALRRLASQLGKTRGITLDVSFGKVAEYQHRGLVHFHAIIRLDQRDPGDPTAILPPPPDTSAVDLDQLIMQAATGTAFQTPPHPGSRQVPAHPAGWNITWGQQLVNRPLTRVGNAAITEEMVAGYVAKYATKSTEVTGHTSRRLTNDTIDHYADYATHTGTLIATCWDYGANPHDPGTPDGHGGWWYPAETGTDTLIQRDQWKHTYGKLRRWAHMLGFGGHFTSKSRRYGPTRKHLKSIRRSYQRSQQLLRQSIHRTADYLAEPDTTLVVNELTYAGIGWLTPGDAELALTAAAKAREHSTTRKDEQHAA